MADLADSWRARFSGGEAVDLRRQPDFLPEILVAACPPGFELVVEDGSYARAAGDLLEVEYRARILAPGMPSAAVPPEAGAVGVMIDYREGETRLEVETLDTPSALYGAGFGTLVMAELVRLAERLEVEAVVLQAGKIGRYAWARCGFDFMFPDSDRPGGSPNASAFRSI